jgi:hypothetical protein
MTEEGDLQVIVMGRMANGAPSTASIADAETSRGPELAPYN